MFSKLNFLKNNLEFHVALKKNRMPVKDLNNAVWFFGCSYVLGVGVKPEETAPYQLSKVINLDVANYGVPGSGPMMVEETLDKLLETYRPLAVVISWPSLLRWQSKESLVPFSVLWGPWSLESNYKTRLNHFGTKKLFPKSWNHYVELLDSDEIINLNLRTIDRVRDKLKQIPTVEFSYVENFSHLSVYNPIWKDRGTTGLHPGPLTHKETAKWLANEIQLLL